MTVSKSTKDPIKQFHLWYEEARKGKAGRSSKSRVISRWGPVFRRLLEVVLPWSPILRPDIATLATKTDENRPAARSVLFKGFVHGGFSFYTDYESNKGKELDANPSAVLVFYWHVPPRQVRIDGRVVKLSREAAEADWNARRRENQAASAAATQSSVVAARADLIEKVNRIKQQYKGQPIPCPDSWGGYTLIPDKMEFWEGRLDWIHVRERYVLNHGIWQWVLLSP